MRSIWQERLKSAIVGALSLVVAQIGVEIYPIFRLIEEYTSKRLLLFLCILLGILLLLNLYSLYSLNRLNLKFGLYWDKQKNPYCPGCRKPLHGFYKQADNHRYGGKCVTCGKSVQLDESTTGKDIDEIKAML